MDMQMYRMWDWVVSKVYYMLAWRHSTQARDLTIKPGRQLASIQAAKDT